MEENKSDFKEKPKEILELEKVYGVVLKEEKTSFDAFITLNAGTYSLNSAGKVNGISIVGKGIADISPSENFNFLEYLEFSDNLIQNIHVLFPKPYLKFLVFERNIIEDITPLLLAADFKGKVFFLDGNRIKVVSKEIAEKFNWLETFLFTNTDESENELILVNNPLEFPPYSVIELGKETVRNYYEAAEKFGHNALSEGRIIVIGEGSSGKTSLIERVLYNSFDKNKTQTNGIKIEHWQLQHEDNRELTFHIWDFGGQEIQHAVHKFFFTEGCLYILVLDNRKEEEPDYWLQQIESLGGKAPVLIVFNKQDENAAETADRKYLKEKYPNIVGFYNTSCKTGFGIDDLKRDMERQAVKLRTVNEQFPNNWLNIKNAIQQNTIGQHHYLTYEAYQEICKQNQTPQEKTQKLLLKYFNTIGAVTWFGEDTHLKFLHVLKPEWITQGVYKILTAKKTAHLFGQIEVSDFKELLQPVNKDDYSYDEKHYGYIVSMMKKFDLCDTPDDRHLLIPSAFGKVPKVEYSEFRGENVRTYILQFKDYMPLALIHRFTARKLSEALENNYWYTGIVIKDSKSNSLAMVHADKEAKRIYIRIKGEAQLGMWEYIRRELAGIASSYAKIPYSELVALDINAENTVNYADLISHVQANEPTYFHPGLKKRFNVGYLLGLFETKEDTLEKLKSGELAAREKGLGKMETVPPVIVNILNNNSPTINTEINTQVNIDIDLQVVNDLGSYVKGDAAYLIDELGESNKTLREALEKVIQFANDAKTAKNSSEVKEKGWHRKLKTVLETLGSAGEQLKKIQDGGETLRSVLHGIQQLASHLHLNTITGLFK